MKNHSDLFISLKFSEFLLQLVSVKFIYFPTLMYLGWETEEIVHLSYILSLDPLDGDMNCHHYSTNFSFRFLSSAGHGGAYSQFQLLGRLRQHICKFEAGLD